MPLTTFEVWLPRIVFWFSLFDMVAVMWPIGGAGLSKRNIALQHGLRLSKGVWLGCELRKSCCGL